MRGIGRGDRERKIGRGDGRKRGMVRAGSKTRLLHAGRQSSLFPLLSNSSFINHMKKKLNDLINHMNEEETL